MDIVVVGINHRTAPLDVREKLWFSSEEIRALLPTIQEQWFPECVMVSTCNRTEIYGTTSSSNGSSPSVETLGQFLINAKSAQPHVQLSHLYMLRSASAVSHLFKVAAGTDSMVVGDVQILNQIKDGFKIALEQKTIGLFLNRLVQSAFHVGKRARTESGINEGAVSISYAAVELATKIFASLSKKSALLVGAGETGELTARHLAGKGIGKLFIANRTRSRAEHLTASLGGAVVDFEQLATTMTEVDIVITSIESSSHIITAGQLSDVMKKRSHKPLCIIDIGVPRNIEPSANLIENIFLYDLDTLSKIIDQNLKKRELEVPLVNAIILEEIRAFQAWYSSLEINPTITDLHRRFEDIRQTEVTKHVNRFSSESDKELLELVTKRIIHKLLHVPTTTLRNGHGEPDDVKRKKIDFLRVLFGLTKEERENS